MAVHYTVPFYLRTPVFMEQAFSFKTICPAYTENFNTLQHSGW
jgi:hypothetical protein